MFEGFNEKKATSEPEIRADATKSSSTTINPMTFPIVILLMVIMLSILAITIDAGSVSKFY